MMKREYVLISNCFIPSHFVRQHPILSPDRYNCFCRWQAQVRRYLQKKKNVRNEFENN